ncbi:MAG TPA: hypothetical protein VM686_03150, partial [Polyangiaceae bacterium]|nr:hypothetical protein [Polyangiaceae bacterium]
MKRLFVTLTLLASACGGSSKPPAPAPVASTPASAAAKPKPPADPLAEPPPAGITPNLPFPTIDHRSLPSGLALRVVPRKSYPVVELRL